MTSQASTVAVASPFCAPAIEFWRDPGLAFFEGRRAIGSVSCYSPHSHPSLSIGIVDSGISIFSLPQRQTRIQSGDVVLIAANEVHSCNPQAQESWSYRMFHVDGEWLAKLLQESGMNAHAVQVSQVLPRHHARQAAVLMDDISMAMSSDDDILHKETVLVSSLCELFKLCQAGPPMTPQTPARDKLETVRAYLLAHCCDRLSLESLAQLAGIGRYQLIRLFSRHFGMTPHAMQLDMRINLARNLLGCGTTPAEVAYRTGFADQSHFHRAFKARVAATPAQYQRTTG